MLYGQIKTHISFETIDNETIVIDLEKGLYYSLTGTASHIWQLIEQGVSLTQIDGYFKGGAETEEIEQFAKDLESEGLIEFCEQGAKLSELPQQQWSYSKPFYEKFDDMEDLLLLDPIHDSSEAGWPHQLSQEVR